MHEFRQLIFIKYCYNDETKADVWAEHIARMGEMKNTYKILAGKVKGRERLQDPGADGKILKWIKLKRM